MHRLRNVCVLENQTITDSWVALMDAIYKQGFTVPDEDYPGMMNKEILCIICVVSRPIELPMIPQRFPWNNFVGIPPEKYAEMFTEKERGKIPPKVLDELLKQEQFRIPRMANLGVSEPPRLLSFKAINREWESKLETNLIAVFTELDIYAEFPPHAFGLAKLAEHITKHLPYPTSVGGLYLIIQPGYIREKDFRSCLSLTRTKETP